MCDYWWSFKAFNSTGSCWFIPLCNPNRGGPGSLMGKLKAKAELCQEDRVSGCAQWRSRLLRVCSTWWNLQRLETLFTGNIHQESHRAPWDTGYHPRSAAWQVNVAPRWMERMAHISQSAHHIWRVRGFPPLCLNEFVLNNILNCFNWGFCSEWSIVFHF